MEVFNSIFITLRERQDFIRTLLESLRISLQQATQSHEIVIVDLGTASYDVEALVNPFREVVPIKVIKTGYTGIFYKTKALNCGVKNSDGHYISLVDADTVVPPEYIFGIEDFFRDESNSNIKLCHRVARVNAIETKNLLKTTLDVGRTQNMVRKAKSYMMYLERFTENEIVKREFTVRDRSLLTKALGNSHFTMPKENYVTIGGYNESFKGWGCEDKEFNLRYYRHFKNGTLRDDPKYMCFSLTCPQESTWRQKTLHDRNLRLYNSTIQNKSISCLKKGDAWGKF